MVIYDRIDLGGPVAVLRVYGSTRSELFENVAYAFFDQVFYLTEITPQHARPVLAAGDDYSQLLANWLLELAAMSAVEEIAPSYFVVDRLEEGGVQGSASGQPFAEVERRQQHLPVLLTTRPAPVCIPDGWWVELRLDLEAASDSGRAW